MYESKAFCDICRKDVDYGVENRQMVATLSGKMYSYLGKVAYCNECGLEVYIAKVIDDNLSNLYDKFRIKS